MATVSPEPPEGSWYAALRSLGVSAVEGGVDDPADRTPWLSVVPMRSQVA